MKISPCAWPRWVLVVSFGLSNVNPGDYTSGHYSLLLINTESTDRLRYVPKLCDN